MPHTGHMTPSEIQASLDEQEKLKNDIVKALSEDRWAKAKACAKRVRLLEQQLRDALQGAERFQSTN